jgi:cell wall assembly regulator SMI1
MTDNLTTRDRTLVWDALQARMKQWRELASHEDASAGKREMCLVAEKRLKSILHKMGWKP